VRTLQQDSGVINGAAYHYQCWDRLIPQARPETSPDQAPRSLERGAHVPTQNRRPRASGPTMKNLVAVLSLVLALGFVAGLAEAG
jgi:hypothetical protein